MLNSDIVILTLVRVHTFHNAEELGIHSRQWMHHLLLINLRLALGFYTVLATHNIFVSWIHVIAAWVFFCFLGSHAFSKLFFFDLYLLNLLGKLWNCIITLLGWNERGSLVDVVVIAVTLNLILIGNFFALVHEDVTILLVCRQNYLMILR